MTLDCGRDPHKPGPMCSAESTVFFRRDVAKKPFSPRNYWELHSGLEKKGAEACCFAMSYETKKENNCKIEQTTMTKSSSLAKTLFAALLLFYKATSADINSDTVATPTEIDLDEVRGKFILHLLCYRGCTALQQ